MRDGIRRAGVAVFVGVAAFACGESVSPEPVVWDDWPWMATSIASPNVVVTGSSVVLDATSGQLRVRARFINTGTDSVLVQHGACAFGVRLREVNGRALMPIAWDDRPAGGACILPLYSFHVAANGIRDVTVKDITPASLRAVVRPGEYHVNIVWRRASDGGVLEASAGTIVVP
ncbi:MAG: hypothetical protein ABMA00_15365 [Gemmatimonas sp.]